MRLLRGGIGRREAFVAILVAMLVLVASACGSGEAQPGASAPSAPPANVETTLYFLTSDRSAPIGVRRSIPRRSPYALEALRALLAGPTGAEQKRGLVTAIPAAAKLVSFRIEANTTAIVDLSGLPRRDSGVDRVRVITQVVRSLVGLSGIERVRLRNDGKPWGLWRMSGGVADVAYGYDNLLGFTLVGGVGGRFSALP